MSVKRIRFVRSSEKGNVMEPQHREEQLKCIEDQMKGIGIPNKNNSYFYKKNVKLYDTQETNVLLERMLNRSRSPIEFSVAQVDRAPARCLGGHGFESCRD